MDFASKKLPLVLIIALLGILALQWYSSESKEQKLIDPQTCEIYIKDPNLNTKTYTNEFDSKCLDFKSLND